MVEAVKAFDQVAQTEKFRPRLLPLARKVRRPDYSCDTCPSAGKAVPFLLPFPIRTNNDPFLRCRRRSTFYTDRIELRFQAASEH